MSKWSPLASMRRSTWKLLRLSPTISVIVFCWRFSAQAICQMHSYGISIECNSIRLFVLPSRLRIDWRFLFMNLKFWIRGKGSARPPQPSFIFCDTPGSATPQGRAFFSPKLFFSTSSSKQKKKIKIRSRFCRCRCLYFTTLGVKYIFLILIPYLYIDVVTRARKPQEVMLRLWVFCISKTPWGFVRVLLRFWKWN